MKLVMQRCSTDCGVAAVAMFCNKTYEEALCAVHPEIKKIMPNTNLKTPFSKLQIGIVRLIGKHCHVAHCKNWQDAPKEAILSVRTEDHKKHQYHWLVKDGNICLDPIGFTGLFESRFFSKYRTCHAVYILE